MKTSTWWLVLAAIVLVGVGVSIYWVSTDGDPKHVAVNPGSLGTDTVAQPPRIFPTLVYPTQLSTRPPSSVAPASRPLPTPNPRLAPTPPPSLETGYEEVAFPPVFGHGWSIDDAGYYVVDIRTGNVWQMGAQVVWAPQGAIAAVWGQGAGTILPTAPGPNYPPSTFDGLYVVDFNARSATRIANHNASPGGWSADGSQIMVSTPAEGSDPNVHSWGLIARDGSTFRQLTPGSLPTLVWQPGGSLFAYLTKRGFGLLEGTAGAIHEVEICSSETCDFFSLDGWSPDGRWLSIRGRRLYLYDSTTGTTEIIGSPYPSAPQWTADSASFLWTEFGDGYTYKTHRLTPNAAFADETVAHDFREAVPSPDTAKLALITGGCRGEGWQVYVANADGSGPVQLTATKLLRYAATWSPDSRKVYFVAFPNRPDLGSGVFSIDVGSGEVRTLAAASAAFNAKSGFVRNYKLSPDGNYLLVQAIPGGFGVCD